MERTNALWLKFFGGGKSCCSVMPRVSAGDCIEERYTAYFCRARESSAGSEIGGWHAPPEQMMATVFFSFTAGSSGIVLASTGGRFCATASFPVSLITDLPNENGATAAR